SATTRKASLVDVADPAAPESTSCFVVVSLDVVNSLLQLAKCKTCCGDVELVKGDREYGLAVKLKLCCKNCGDVASEWSSPRVEGPSKINPFEINVLAACAMQATGNGQTALNDIFATMNISHRGLHNKTYQRYVKKKLNPATKRAAAKVATKCATSVDALYKQLSYGSPSNIAVSYDGSWKTRGHSSHIGVGTVIELFSGFVLDQVVLSNFCLACEKGPKEGTVGYEEWKASHEASQNCQKNTNSKAGQMEVEAALILFKRSWERHHLRYTTMLCDGDSRSFTALQEENVYGIFPIEKEDCVNHKQKRMGTALRSLVQKHKGAVGMSLGGRGRLTAELITRLSSYYGWALKSHEGNVDAMHDAVMATYHHVTSNDTKANHSLCPSGEESWCKQNAARAKGEPVPKHHYSLPDHVCAALLPVYIRLADKKLLQRCQRGKTQNANESLHSVIWSLAPKDQNASLFTVESAVAEATIRFNVGSQQASAAILRELNLDPSKKCMKRGAEKDLRRSAASESKRAGQDNIQKAMKKKHAGKMHTDYAPGGF
ncbi:unnamed protein product, partial [Ixodes pacificus]